MYNNQWHTQQTVAGILPRIRTLVSCGRWLLSELRKWSTPEKIVCFPIRNPVPCTLHTSWDHDASPLGTPIWAADYP